MKKAESKKLIFEMIIVAAIILIFFHTVFAGRIVKSASMEPLIKENSIVLINRLAYKKRAVKRGDVILFKTDGVEEIKRVIALPGEKVRFQDGFVIVDDKIYLEDYIPEITETNSNETFEVPKGCFFVLGDNREHSYDSRFFKNPYINKTKIKGKAVAFFSKGRMHLIPSIKTTN